MEKLRQMHPRGSRFVPSVVEPAPPNEDPALIQGPIPQNTGYPSRKLPVPLRGLPLPGSRLPCPLVGIIFPTCVEWFDICVDGVTRSQFWPGRCSSCMRNGALAPDGEWFFRSSSRKSGKFRCTPPTYWIRSYACAGGGIEAVKKQITGVTCFAKLNGIGG